jgi:hypothetical protein
METMIIALRGINGGFSAACATGFTPGAPLPTFPNNSFAMSSSNSSSGSGDGNKLTYKQLEDNLKANNVNPNTAELIAMWAEDLKIDPSAVQSLIDAGLSPDEVLSMLDDGTITSSNINDATLLAQKGATASQISAWVSRGVNLSDAAAFANIKGVDLNSAIALTRAGLDPKNVSSLLQDGVSSNTILNMLKQPGVNPGNVASKIEANITALINDTNPGFRANRAYAIQMLNGPDGTYPVVAGSAGAGGDIQFIDPKTGNVALTRELKNVLTQGGFGHEMDGLPAQFAGSTSPKEADFQVPSGTNAQSWIQGYIKGKTPSSLAKYKGIEIILRDPQGNVIWDGYISK